MKSIAAFISPHGFGHAARTSSILSFLRLKNPEVSLDIFTTVPAWFFEDSFASTDFNYHSVLTDVGVAQRSALDEDLDTTVKKLSELLPYRAELVEECCRIVRERNITHILCDISPLGLLVAERCGIPSVLIENFTWDWIYEGYVEQEARLAYYIELFRGLFDKATISIETEPSHRRSQTTFIAPPVSREPRISVDETRRTLGIDDAQKLVLITMGGHSAEYDFVEKLKGDPSITFLISSNGSSITRDGNIIYFPPRSGYYHPDLVAASDLVIAKLGYSTMAEAWSSGVPLAYVARRSFREGDLLESFLRDELPSSKIDLEEWSSGEWVNTALALIGKRSGVRERMNGGERIANYLMDTFR